MSETSATTGLYGIGITLLSVGGLLTITIAGAVLGVPMMLVGAVIVGYGWYYDEDDADTAQPA